MVEGALARDRVSQSESVRIRKSDFGPMLFPPLHVPPARAGMLPMTPCALNGIVAAANPPPSPETVARLFRLLSVQSLETHLDASVLSGFTWACSPQWSLKRCCPVEAHELADQAPIRIIRRRFDREVRGTEELRQIVNTQRHLAHHAEAAATAALQRPEQIGVRACIRDANCAVRSDHFGFEQASCGEAVAFRITAKATALNQTRQAHRQASATLNIFPALVVTASYACIPIDSGAERDRRLRRRRARILVERMRYAS